MCYKQTGPPLALDENDDTASRAALNVKDGPARALHSPLETTNAAMVVMYDNKRGGCVMALAEGRRWSLDDAPPGLLSTKIPMSVQFKHH